MSKTHVPPEPVYTRANGVKVHFTESVPPGKDQAKIRSATFPGIARAMAEQWGSIKLKKYCIFEDQLELFDYAI